MKTGYVIVLAASIVSLLASCASYDKAADSGSWKVKPAFNVRHSAETAESYYQLGRYYQGQNRYEQAMAAYRKALAIDGGFVEAHNGMGVVYARQGRQDEALGQFRLAAKLAPDAAHIQNNLGYALYLSGAYVEAAGTLERALALDPANPATRANLARALEKAGDGEEAQVLLAQAPVVPPAENAPPAPSQPEALPARIEAAAAPAVPVAVAAAAPVQAPPRERVVIAPAAQKPVPVVESRIQAIQLAPNVYELRKQADAQVVRATAAIPAPAPALPKAWSTATLAAVPASYVPARQTMPAAAAPQQPQAAVATSPAARPFRIEVSNGNGVTGMAKKVAGYLGGKGYAGARLTNQKPFRVVSSQVQYRAGYREQARSLVAALPGAPALAQASNLRGDISIRVVLGRDVADKVAYFEPGPGRVHLSLKDNPAKY